MSKGRTAAPVIFASLVVAVQRVGLDAEKRGKDTVLACLALVRCIPHRLPVLQGLDETAIFMTVDDAVSKLVAGFREDVVGQGVAQLLVGEAHRLMLDSSLPAKSTEQK